MDQELVHDISFKYLIYINHLRHTTEKQIREKNTTERPAVGSFDGALRSGISFAKGGSVRKPGEHRTSCKLFQTRASGLKHDSGCVFNERTHSHGEQL